MENQQHRSSPWKMAGVSLVVSISLVGLGSTPTNAAAGADASWAPPDTVGTGFFPALAVGHGTTTVAWNTTAYWAEGAIRVRRFVAGKGWGPTREIGTGGSVEVASSRSNVTVAAWYLGEERGGYYESYRVMVARRGPGGPWGNPEVIAEVRSPRNPNDLNVAVSDSGAAAVSWTEEIDDEVDQTFPGCEQGKNWSFVAYSTPSGVWESPHELISRRCFMETHVGIGRRGNVVVVYTHRGIQLTRRLIGRGWTAPRTIAHDFAYEVRLMRTPGGGTLVVAWEGGTNHDWKYGARRRTNGRWGPVEIWKRLPPSPKSDEFHWGSAMEGNGHSTLAVTGPDDGVQVWEWPRDEPIGPERTIAEPTLGEGIEVAAGARGDTLVSFFAFVGAGAALHTLYRPRGAPWGPDQVLTGPDLMAGFYDLAVRPSGTVDAVWDDPSARGSKSVIRHSRLAHH